MDATITDLFNWTVVKPLIGLSIGTIFCLLTHGIMNAAYALPWDSIYNAVSSWDFSGLKPVDLSTALPPDGCHVHPNGDLHCPAGKGAEPELDIEW